jgi:hypothetical protein
MVLMKDLKIQDLKPITKSDQILKQLLDEETYNDELEERKYGTTQDN